MTTTIQTLHTSNMTYNLLNINNNHNNIQMNMINFNDNDLLLEKPDKSMISKKCPKRINSVAVHQPASVARRNARERNRVKQVNNGFATLRQHIPSSIMATSTLKMPNGTSVTSNRSNSTNKKLSKVETLRSAVEYIRCLQQLLEDHDENLSMNQCSSTVDTPDSFIYQNALNSSFLQELQQSPNGSVSPTPSFCSTNSSLLSTDLSSPASYSYLVNNQSSLVYQQQAPQQQSQLQLPQQQQQQQQLIHLDHQQFQKLENFENFQPTSPEDEELLDAIAWWQQ